MGKLASAGIGGQFLSNMLAGAREGNTDWIAHSKSESMVLTFESGQTVTMSAADMDSSVLAAYGYSYNSVDGIISTRGFFDDTKGLPSGPEWTLRDGVLTRPSMTSVTGEVLGNIALEIPSGALALAGSASLLANHAFDGLIPDASGDRLASAVSGPNAPSAPVSGSPAVVHSTRVMDGARLDDFLVEPSRASTAVSGTGGSGSGATAAPGSGSLYASELEQEHARFYSENVGQADAAQQAEYASNQAIKAAAVQARIDSLMAQAGAANAVDVGYGPGVPAAPGYGPADVLASGQPASGVPIASGTDSQQPGIFARQGFSNDGRVVPNIFKVVNQDLWAGWGKSSGAEAVLTFPFVLAMSGAVFLPQSFNDIPNIPTLLATALTETDNGNWGEGLEAAGDGLGALGMLGEFMAGAEALSVEGAVGNAREAPGSPSRYDVTNAEPPPWTVKNLRPDEGVVIQKFENSCNGAVAEMVARAGPEGLADVVNESTLMNRIARNTGNQAILSGKQGMYTEYLVEAANELEVESSIISDGKSWKMDNRQLPDALTEVDRITTDGPFGAEMLLDDTYHVVQVVGTEAGEIKILDPAGYRYEMTPAEFDSAWNEVYYTRR